MPTVLGQRIADPVRARVLPDDGVVVRFAGCRIPDHGGLALVGHANGGDVTRLDADLLKGAFNHVLGASPNLHRIVLDPAGFGVNLLVLHLMNTDDAATVVEEHTAGTGRTLINCRNIFCHFTFLLIKSS